MCVCERERERESANTHIHTTRVYKREREEKERRRKGVMEEFRLRVSGGLQGSQGVWTAEVSVGTPEVTYTLIVDTGSALTILDNAHERVRSTTRERIAAGETACVEVPHTLPGRCRHQVEGEEEDEEECSCLFSVTYAEHSEYRGSVVRDVLHENDDNTEVVSGRKVSLGLSTSASGLVVQSQGRNGVLGLARNGFMRQLGVHQMRMCLPMNNGMMSQGDNGDDATGVVERNGILLFGSAADDDGEAVDAFGNANRMKYAKLVVEGEKASSSSSERFYRVRVSRIEFISPPPSPSTVFIGERTEEEQEEAYVINVRDDFASFIIDSGTSLSRLPSREFKAIMNHIIDERCRKRHDGIACRQIEGPQPDVYTDYCFEIARSEYGDETREPMVIDVNAVFPRMRLHMDAAGPGDDASPVHVDFAATNYLFRHGQHSPNAWCLGISDAGSRSAVLGGIALRDMMVHIDITERSRIGFRGERCGAIQNTSSSTLVAESRHSDTKESIDVHVQRLDDNDGDALLARSSAGLSSFAILNIFILILSIIMAGAVVVFIKHRRTRATPWMRRRSQSRSGGLALQHLLESIADAQEDNDDDN